MRKNSNTLIPKAKFPTDFGEFYIYAFSDDLVVLKMGDVKNKKDVLVRVHSGCLTSEVLGSKRCDCRDQLQKSLEIISSSSGLLIYLKNHEGRGIGLLNKIRAYELQDVGFDTVEANHQLGFETDLRKYNLVKSILNYFSVSSIKLLTNNPEKVKQIKESGIIISERIPLTTPMTKFNEKYLKTKKEKMGHLL